MADESTSSFYNDNAATYASRQRMLPIRRLDAFPVAAASRRSHPRLGCGGGQDSAYMLSKGFDVTPTDGSPAVAKQAEVLLRHPVEVLRFEDLDEEEAFDGVWAEASLLHVPRAALPEVLERIRTALQPAAPSTPRSRQAKRKDTTASVATTTIRRRNCFPEMLSNGGWHNIVISEGDGSGYDGKPTRWLAVRTQK